MFARAGARSREIAVRLAIGASRVRVFRQLIAESLLLAALGGFAGVWLALLLSRVLVTILTSDGGPWTLDLAIDWRLVAFIVTLAAVTCLCFGLMPALRATRTPPGAVMKLSGRGLTADRGRFLVRRVLVAGQVAISLVLVVAALLFTGTLRNLAGVQTGFSDAGVLMVNLDLRPAGVASEALVAYQSDLVERLRHVPGVAHAAAASIVPLSGSGWNETILIDGRIADGHPDANRVSPSFFDTLEIPFVRGRNFDARDRAGAQPVAIVNESFAAKYYPGTNPIGRGFRVQVGPGQPDPTYEVIGVVRDTKYRQLRDDPGPIMYFADAQETAPFPFLAVLLRAQGETDAIRGAVAHAVGQVHPKIVLTLREMRTYRENALLRERLVAALSGGFAVLAVVLAAVGLYGLLAYGVSRRRGEIGIRVALGATRARIVRLVVHEASWLLVAGLGVGLILTIATARAASAMLYGLSPGDPATLAAGVLTLALVAATASAIPAWRAARVDPSRAIREE
jgi:predicted permease